jgi:hypothetical protein
MTACGASPSVVRIGGKSYTLCSGDVGHLRDSTDSICNEAVLRQNFEEDGYIFLRGVLPQEAVQRGREAVLEQLDAQGLVDTSAGKSLEEAVVKVSHSSDQGMLKDSSKLIQTETFKSVVEHDALFDLFQRFFGKPCATFDFKWLRVVKSPESTGFHMDSVYMYRGSPKLVTCWVPFCEVPYELGGLVVLRGSHRAESWQRTRDTYGKLDLDRDDVGGTGWLTEDPEEALRLGGTLETAHFKPGDVVFFGMKTLHGSSENLTNRWRISADVRFQPKDEPLDERWLFDKEGNIPGLGSRWVKHRNDPDIFPKSMEDAKSEWGIQWKRQAVAAGVEEPPSKVTRKGA